MPFEQTVTIINNSGKIISTGKHLVSIFKEARSAYKEKKEALKQERSGNFRRAHTFNVARSSSFHGPFVEEYDDGRHYDEYDEQYHRNHRSLGYHHNPGLIEDGRRLSLDDGDHRSHVSYMSSDSRRQPRLKRSSTAGDATSHSGRGERRIPRPPLTINNLRTLTEVSATRPSVAPQSFRPNLQPYAETAPRDMMASRVALDEAVPPPFAADLSRGPSVAAPRSSMMVHRPRSDPAMNRHARGTTSVSSSHPIDMHLAYGDIPPDLASRADLDAVGDESPDQKKAEAQTLVDRVESLLNEAHCIHHTATSIIRHLQDNPEAAAAVALTLAELSAILTKLSPAFLGVVKGGSPAVFALLASPQFLIGTSIAVGVTVVLFGGWKIVKRISEVNAAREDKAAIEMAEQSPSQPQTQQIPGERPNLALPANNRPPTLISNGFDEALVLEEELSTIECWRRGIVQPPDSDRETEPWEGTEVTEAEIELISPEAMRSRITLDDERTLRSVRTRRSTKSHSHYQSSSTRGESTRKGKKPRAEESSLDIPERHSSKDSHHDDSQSKSGDRHRSRSHRDRHDGLESEAGSVSTSRSSHRSHSRRHKESRGDGSKASGPSVIVTPPSEAGSAASKDKKAITGGNGGNMLKQLFKKKKEKEAKHKDGASVSVMA
ncbi:hypothetical protein F503_08879 [Ophiostoma piceae UAMH 11346]|uniref:Uncharacterized protein n=1 Tax=Ophiostoma piceae (strain UAMH 11346) TaxID=1262450 RepID=S3BRE4_OPHP1|nr:hypothetical protein F503_08879 [Ophiostoma piceae UAMH 11346]